MTSNTCQTAGYNDHMSTGQEQSNGESMRNKLALSIHRMKKMVAPNSVSGLADANRIRYYQMKYRPVSLPVLELSLLTLPPQKKYHRHPRSVDTVHPANW